MTDKKSDITPLPAKAANSTVKKRLLDAAVEIMGHDAETLDELGFLYTVHANCFMPRGPVKADTYSQKNGIASLHMQAGSVFDAETQDWVKIPLPFGTKPRVALVFINTAIKLYDSDVIDLGRSYTDFVKRTGGTAISGGRNGSFTHWRKQMNSLAATDMRLGFHLDKQLENGERLIGSRTSRLEMIKDMDVFFTQKDPDQTTLFSNTLTVSKGYFEAVKKHAMPVDMRAIRALTKDALAFDIYLWMTFRLPRVARRTDISWEALYIQFGGNYSDIYSFKRRFLQAFKTAKILYPRANITPWEKGKKIIGFRLLPSPKAVSHKDVKLLT